MKNSKIFFSLLTAFLLSLALAACSHEKSLGNILDDFFSTNSERTFPTEVPSPVSTPTYKKSDYTEIVPESTFAVYSPNPNAIPFQQTIVAFQEIHNESPIDSILNDFYSYHNERGFQAVESILDTDPNNAIALALRGAFKMRQKEWESGFEDSNMALALDPNLAFAHVNLAWYDQYYLLDRETARNEIDTALALDPNLAYAHCIMAGLHDTGSGSQAIFDSYTKAVELRPDYYVAYTNLGSLTSPSDDDFNGSVSYFDKAIAINPDEGRAYYERGVIFDIFWVGPERVIADFSQAIKLGYKIPNAYESRAVNFIRIGAYANAIDDLEHVIELDPERTNAYNTAAILLAYTNGDLNKASVYNNIALERMPEENRYLDTRGYIYYKLEKYDEAFQIFSELIENDYQYAYYGRGLIYYKMGEKENAIGDLQKYIDAQSGDFRTEEAEQLLIEMGAMDEYIE